MFDQETQKRMAAEAAVEYIEDGQTVGLGTGSTMSYVIKALGRKVQEGLDIRCLGSSVKTEMLADQNGLKLLSSYDIESIDIAIDGADQITSKFQMIKGGGGALHREKVILLSSKQNIIVVDESKMVPKFGGFPLPIEVTQFSCPIVYSFLESQGFDPSIRAGENQSLFITDNANNIIDCSITDIDNPADLEINIKSLSGVVEVGLFLDLVDMVIVGGKEGVSGHRVFRG